ncbi:group II intron reverse transcriptase/maturase [Leptospira sp. id769339]|uniref:group II intron reverse transcriptase/maturase n=1 Tax=Leptospira sp. id769339 TaxID=2864221 RepID=UPI00214A9DE8|nr:group II intron reverse transcriptase/maturase [Leptospira sp. id769339]
MHVSNDQPHPILIDSSRELQRKLYLAAKRSRNRRFHALYDRIHRPDILWRAWMEVKANGGSGGIDNISFDRIEQDGVENFLRSLEEELKRKEYRPSPVLRVNIPKPDGSKRPLGIPTIRDRVVQQACKIIIEPIFEANFLENSFGFRPRRSATQAVTEVRNSLVYNWWVVDADIQKYFDTIDHEILTKLLRRRISDRRVLKLISQWLKAGVVDNGKFQPSELGSPQGGVISPLLANIYLHVFDMYWQRDCEHLGKLVRYADDFVIICRYESEAKEALRVATKILERLKLRLHPVKTRLVRLDKDGFDFLGFQFRKSRSPKTGKLVPYFWPSKKAMKSIRAKIKEFTTRQQCWLGLPGVALNLNPIIRGWKNYFRAGNSTLQFQTMDRYLLYRLFHFALKLRGNRAGFFGVNDFQPLYAACGFERFYYPGGTGTHRTRMPKEE